jgi:hypothetical protein
MRYFITSLILTCFSIASFSQAPQKFSYQAVVRNSTNQLVSNGSVGVKISIVQTSETGSVVYQELFNPNPVTNANGLVTLQVGAGIPLIGTFAGIDWANGPYYIKSEFDPSGGTNYTVTGTTQLLSVPYALFAGGSSNNTLPVGANQGDILYWNGTSWVVLAMGTERQELTICNGQLKWAPYLPSVTTSSPVSSITQLTAIVSGNVTNDGCGTVNRGVCYSTSTNPTLANTVVNSGQGTGSFQATLSNLSPATTYYVKAFATNGAGTTYGNQVTFQTSIVTLPSLYLDSASFTRIYSDSINLFSFGQYFNGNLTSTGGSATTTGFVWSTTSSPDLTDYIITYGTLNSPINFTSTAGIFFGTWYYNNNQTPILYPNTTYYVRAFATNSVGTAYSNQLMIQTEAGAEGTTGPGGGKIVYDRGEYINGWRYLEIATSDISSSAAWGCPGTIMGSSFSEGEGLYNTNSIITACPTAGIAAALCANYTQNGTSDWFLPSLKEFVFLFYAANFLPNIPNITGTYWTSTADLYNYDYNYALSLTASGTNNSGGESTLRSTGLKVRAMRKF